MMLDDRTTGAARGPRIRHRQRVGMTMAAIIMVGAVLASCSSSPGTTPTTTHSSTTSASSTPASAIKVGAIATRTGVGAGDFAAFIPGLQAYFDMVNAEGGINGRKLVLSANLDDGGSPTQFTQEAHTLLQQDHVFAAFISTYWFTPGLFAETGTPTYGYNVSDNWAGPPN